VCVRRRAGSSSPDIQAKILESQFPSISTVTGENHYTQAKRPSRKLLEV